MQKKFISNDILKEDVLDLATDEEKLSLTKLLSENETEAYSSSKLQKEICKLDKSKGSYLSIVDKAVNELNIKGLPSYALVVKYYDEIDLLKYTKKESRQKARNHANKAENKIILKVLENIYEILDIDKQKEFNEQINKIAKKHDSNISLKLVGTTGLAVLGNLDDGYVINEFLVSIFSITSFTRLGIIALDKLKNKKIILIVAIIGAVQARIELDEIDKIMSEYKKNTKTVSKNDENNKAVLKVKKEEDITIELAEAIHKSDLDKLGKLIKNGLNVNTKFSDGSTPLVYASYYGSFAVIKLLINNGANTKDTFNGKYAGLLLFLINSDDVRTIHFLLKNGLNTNITINNMPLIVMLILLDASDDMMELFLNYGIDININYKNIPLLFFAIMVKSSANTIDILVKNTPDLNIETVDNMPILAFAIVRRAPVNIIKILIQHGADTNIVIEDLPLFALALFFETSVDIIDLLVSNGADINVKIEEEAQLLTMAVVLQCPEEIIDYFYENTKDIDFDLLLQAAIIVNNTKIIEKLLQQKININKLNEDGNSHLQDILNDLTSQGKINFLEEEKLIFSQNDLLYSMKKNINIQKEKVKKILNIKRGNDYVQVYAKVQDSLQKLYYEVMDIFDTINEKFIQTQEEFIYTPTSKLRAIQEIHHNSNSFIDVFIKYGGNINNKNNFGDTALSIAYKGNDIETTKVLVQRGADVNIKINKNLTLYEATIMNQQQELQKLIESSPTFIREQHSPQKLVKLLSNFRSDTPIKYTTHMWDMNFKEDYGDFKVYLSRVKQQWNEMDKELESLSPRLHTKIYNFLLNTDANSKSWCSKNGDDINIGWSSLKGLEEWCNDGNDPFNFQLEKPYKVNNSTVTTFGEVITLFKQEIQIRNENNMLENIFIDIEEQLDDEFDGVFEFKLINLKGKTFYTDTEVFKSVLVDRIFKDITREERHKYNKIKVEIAPNTSSDYHELRITQIGSQSNQSSQDMLHHHGADTSIIKKELTNLCDWSIESSSDTENYRINYLKKDTTLEDIEPLDYKPEGYTHIMRFYK